MLESDWTLGAIKRREDERLRNERASSPSDVESARTHRASDLSGNNWIAEAFRRRQEEERARARQQSASGDRAHLASKEVPVDNWLIEGFKRHQQDERRKEMIATSEESGALTIKVVSALDDRVAVEQISKRADDSYANQSAAPDADYNAPAFGSVVSRDGRMAPEKGFSRAAVILVAALLVVGGLLSFIGLRTALWSPASAPKPIGRGDAPSAPPAGKQKDSRTNTRSAPVKAGENETKQSIQSEGSKQNSATPHAQQEIKIDAPALEQAKPAQQNQAAPAAAEPPPAPAQPPATAPASSSKSDKNLNAEPASVGSERSPQHVRPEQEQSAPDSKPRAANVDAKSKEKSVAGRHPQRKTDGISTLLKRTANSVRRFFGRLAD